MKYGKRSRSTRSRKTFRKRPFKSTFKRRSKSLTNRVQTLEKKVRVLKPERKFRWSPGDDADFEQQIGGNPQAGGGGSYGWFGANIELARIAQGVEKDQRIGNQLIKGSYRCHMNIKVSCPQVTEAASLAQDRWLRCVVVQTDDIITNFTDGDYILPNVDSDYSRVFSPYSPDVLKSNGIHILYDKVHKWRKALYNYDAGNPFNGGQITPQYHFKLRFRVKSKICYSGSAASSLLTPVYVLFFDDADNINIAPTVHITSMAEYWQDNN